MRPLVLLHGIGSGPGAWQPQVEALSSEREVLAPDLVAAYGRGLEAAAHEVSQLVSARSPVDLCGLSLGGLVALRVAAEQRESVERLIVCAAFRRLPRNLRVRVQGMALVAGLLPSRFLHRQLVAEVPERYRAEAALQIARLRSRQLARVMRQGASFEVDPASISARTLVLCGERDEANLPLALDLADLVAGSTFALVPDAGHVANLDNPAAFTALLCQHETS